MARLLSWLKFKTWIENVRWNGDSPEGRLATLDEIVTRLERVGLFAAALVCDSFAF